MPSIFKEFLLIFGITLLGGAYSLVSGLAPLPWAEPELEAGEIRLADAMALDAIWLDARSLAEYEQEHIPGATFFDEAAWDEGLFELMNLWIEQPRPIVIYCGSASCGTSKRIAEQLRADLSGAEIYSLKGGWDAWQK